MKKRILTAALTVALSLTTVCSAKAATTIDVHYNNWDMPITGYLKDGTTYVPIRQFFQLLGGSWVTWNSAELSANVRGNANAAFYLGSRIAWIDSEKHQLPGRSYSQDGTFYVPLRGIAEALDCGISYNSSLQRVTLTTKGSSSQNTADSSAYKDSVYWLARIIQAESGAEPYRGKLAVGNVILNRVASVDFPNSIYGVIFDRKNCVQFTPVANGTIYNTPSAESIRAAEECLAGTRVVGNCLYFFNPKTATKASWIVQNCRYYTSIGDHDFYLAP
jgi:N-acetylmuramoyl-L-alanine amidase